MSKLFDWIKNNMLLAVGAAALIIILFFPKLLGSTRRRRVRRLYRPAVRRRIPRRVGLTRRGVPRKQYTKGGKAKKAWQIKGSRAARLHMARIRRMR